MNVHRLRQTSNSVKADNSDDDDNGGDIRPTRKTNDSMYRSDINST